MAILKPQESEATTLGTAAMPLTASTIQMATAGVEGLVSILTLEVRLAGWPRVIPQTIGELLQKPRRGVIGNGAYDASSAVPSMHSDGRGRLEKFDGLRWLFSIGQRFCM